MSSIFSGGNILNMVSEVALTAATGGMSQIVEQLAQQLIGSIVSQGIQQAGSQLGFSQSDISNAQQAAGGSFGAGGSVQDAVSAATQQLGLTPFQSGQLQGQADQGSNSISQMLLDGLRGSGDSNENSGAHRGKGGMSVLMAIAYAMGKQMDNKLDDIADKANQLGNSQSNSSQYGQLSSEIQAESQELGMLSNAVNNAIKSIGDAGSTMAKKD